MIDPEEIEEKCSDSKCAYNSPQGCMLLNGCIYGFGDLEDEEPIDYY